MHAAVIVGELGSVQRSGHIEEEFGMEGCPTLGVPCKTPGVSTGSYRRPVASASTTYVRRPPGDRLVGLDNLKITMRNFPSSGVKPVPVVNVAK
jgi:hypothetical protein